LDMHQCI